MEHRDTSRKGSKLLYEYLDAGWTLNEPGTDPITFDNPSDKIAAHKDRIKLQTEKLEYNRWLRQDARNELLIEKIIDAISDMPKLEVPEGIGCKITNKEGILLYGDEHFGTEYEILGLENEVINSYSPEIFERRMWDLLFQTKKIIEKEGINTLNTYSMGDFTDGILRVSQLMKLRYGVVEGTVKYADFICNWLNELTKFVHVKFQMVAGNHSELRMLSQPKGTFENENMDLVVRAMIKTRLADNSNFEFIENPTGKIFDNILGFNVIGIHGETKSLDKTIKDFSFVYNKKISYIFAGHMHHSKTETIGINAECINVPSIIGIDDYSMSLNKTSNPGATLLIFEENKGKIIEYSIKL